VSQITQTCLIKPGFGADLYLVKSHKSLINSEAIASLYVNFSLISKKSYCHLSPTLKRRPDWKAAKLATIFSVK